MKTIRQHLRQACALLLLACVPAIGAAIVTHPQWHEAPLGPGEITLAAALQQQAPLWIDARPSADYARKHIPGALSLNQDDWPNLLPHVLETWNPGQASIVYCSSQRCQESHEVAERLREFKLGPVYVLKGGWETWKRR